jgi:hypothetical protein
VSPVDGVVPTVLCTAEATTRLGGNSVAVSPWHHVTLERQGRSPLTVIGVPAVHGPDGTESSSGPVIGFVLVADDVPTTYISGDNASLRVVEEVAHHLAQSTWASCSRVRRAPRASTATCRLRPR